MRTQRQNLSDGLLPELLQDVRAELGEAERKEYFNLHYWRYLETLNECLPWVAGRILDIGIVPGHLSMALRRLECQVFRVTDHAGEAEGRLRKDSDLSKRWAREQITVAPACVDREVLPFPDGFFNCVLFTEVLEHLLYDPRCLVREIHRVLKPGGGLVVSTPNVLRAENRFNLLLGRNIYAPLEQFYFCNFYRRHNREYTRDEAVRLFQPCFVLKKASYIMPWEHARPVSGQGKI